MSEKASIAILILTYNETLHLRRAIESVLPFAQEIFVVDSFSTDGTAELASSLGAQVLQHSFINYAKQFLWALDNAPISANWVMRLDADEVVGDDLADEIRKRLPALPPQVCGINLVRKTIFMGRFLRHGGRYPIVSTRIWRRGKARIEDRWMDEHMYITEGELTTFQRGRYADFNLNDLTFFTEKHNRYASREALDVLNQRLHLFDSAAGLAAASTAANARFRRWAKESVYNKLPLGISALAYFIYRYVFQLGFLDGREGLIYHVLQGFWYRFLVGAKLAELEEAIRGARDEGQIIEILSRKTRMDVAAYWKAPKWNA